VAAGSTSGLTEPDLVDLVIGRRLAGESRSAAAASGGGPLLELSGVRGGPVREATMSVARGEVVGIAGLLGSGRSHLLRMLFGCAPIEAGTVTLDGRPAAARSPKQAMDSGIALIPQDRPVQASLADLSVRENLSAASITKYWRRFRLARKPERRDASEALGAYGIAAASPTVTMATLSGGNQQKVILGRWLRRRPLLMLLDEPTQGVDAGAREQVYQLVFEAVRDGAGAIVVASDFEELVRVCDRVVVMIRGRIVTTLDGADLTAHRLTELAFGHEHRELEGVRGHGD